MNQLFIIGALVCTLGLGIVSTHASGIQRQSVRTAQPAPQAVPTKAMALTTVHIPRAVKADDQRVGPGIYRVQLAGAPLKPAVGETRNLEQWVEFLQRGKVKGKAVASIVPPDQIHEVAKERVPTPGHTRIGPAERGRVRPRMDQPRRKQVTQEV